mmetsp:Transcript_56745/g.157992  ORF Transcript_56745/g.157992 Transcript_56745/m.157992 type:complete len:197 (+) Transcript_56745:112-702(+)
MVGQRLQEYIRSRGFEAEDVPKVVGVFVAAKYATLAASVALGARYQPLRRLFPKRTPPSSWQRLKEAYGRRRRHFLRRFSREEEASRRLWGGWYIWMAEHYWHLSDKLQATAQNNRLWSAMIKHAGGNPRSLALGIAEGTILCKVTFPLWGPLELWLILSLFRRRDSALASDGMEPKGPPLGGLLEGYSGDEDASE